MKITCAIDGVGVRERLQAKAKSTEDGAKSPAKRSKTRAYKLRAAKPPAANVPPTKTTKPTTRAFSRAEHVVQDSPDGKYRMHRAGEDRQIKFQT
jgi:hypothetical protein